MLPFKAGDKKFNIPTSWDEITLNQALKLSTLKESYEQENHIKLLSILTGLDEDTCSRIAIDDFMNLLLPVLQFMNEPFNQDNLMRMPLPYQVDLGGVIYNKFYNAGQMVWAQHLTFEAISSNKKLTDLEKIPQIIAICIQKPDQFSDVFIDDLLPSILNLSMFDAMAIAGYYLREITSFYKRANLKTNDDYTSEQIRAGIKEFSKFGAFNSIDALAGGDITKWDQVVMLPMSDVVLKMKMNQQQYRYEKKYHDIMLKKK